MALLFSIATGVMESIGSQIAKPGGAYASQMIQLFCCGEGELHSLEETVKTIQAVLMDAEKKQWQDKQVKHWVRRLKDVLYDAQDLFDDISTEDLRRQAMAGNEMMKELPSEEKMATGRRKKPEFLAPDTKIIGREEDKEKIKQILFDSSSSNTVSVVSIVGKGGLGKTALARLVYNDGEVKGRFGLKMWVCVSDVFDVDLIFKEILKSAKRDCRGHDDEMKELLDDVENEPKDQLPSLLRETLSRKKYLLVLDDLWNEVRHKWLELGEWLEGGLPGSKILVTTRIHKVAEVMDKKSDIHVLRGLAENESWNLFRKMAFGDGVDPELEEIGLDIVKKCAGIPLAIRTIGGLLYDKKKDEWLRYKVHEFPEIPEIDEVDDGIMQVLNFSYDRLPSCLKHCFAYCSLFPKDYVYGKQKMIQLWVAQGFIESHSREDDLEEVANNYLEELLDSSKDKDLPSTSLDQHEGMDMDLGERRNRRFILWRGCSEDITHRAEVNKVANTITSPHLLVWLGRETVSEAIAIVKKPRRDVVTLVPPIPDLSLMKSVIPSMSPPGARPSPFHRHTYAISWYKTPVNSPVMSAKKPLRYVALTWTSSLLVYATQSMLSMNKLAFWTLLQYQGVF
ncbi:hypothetical protein NL676_038872 [Syzygium grande]|nr:hypothetical protein NL676_038872 [Syzygium grande]